MDVTLFDQSQVRIQQTFESISKMKSLLRSFKDSEYLVPLPVDPSLEGSLSVISRKLEEIQRMKDKLLLFYHEYQEVEDLYDILLTSCKETLTLRRNTITVQDPLVQQQKNMGLQSAFVDSQLETLIILKNSIQEERDHVHNSILKMKEMLANLESTNNNQSRQLSVCQLQLEVGEIVRKSPQPR